MTACESVLTNQVPVNELSTKPDFNPLLQFEANAAGKDSEDRRRTRRSNSKRYSNCLCVSTNLGSRPCQRFPF